MPERRSRPRASGAEFRGGGSARHWGDPDALERQALLEALTSADDEMLRGEMPLSPGSVLGVARRVPEWLRRLRRGLTPKTGASTAPTGNVLQKTVLSDKPAQMSRRGFLLDPVQMLSDIPQSLEEIGRPKGLDKVPGGRDDPRWGDPRAPGNWAAFEDATHDAERRGLQTIGGDDDSLFAPNIPEQTIQHVTPKGRSTLISDAMEEDATNWVDSLREKNRPAGAESLSPYPESRLPRVQETFEQLDAALSDRPGVLGDVDTVGRSWGDQALKEIAEETGKSYEEVKADVRRRQEEPGPVAQAAAGVRRRFGRRRRK